MYRWMIVGGVTLLLLYLILQWFLCQNAVRRGYTRLESYGPETAQLHSGKMAYVDRGAGETILVAHGISGGYDQAFETARDLAENFRILAPSRFGYPGSDLPEDAAPAAQARAYAALLDELGIEKAYILGTSAGGTVAIRFALDYPERSSGLILYCSAAPLTEKPEKYTEYQGPPAFLCNDFGMWLMKPLLRPIMGMDSDTIYEMLPVRERRDGMVLDASVTNPDMARNYDAYPIEDLEAPVLIFHAQDDKLSDYAAMVSVLGRFPDCTLVSFPDGGHLMEGHEEEIKAAWSDFTGWKEGDETEESVMPKS